MKLTEKKLREFFPFNDRFIHFVAKKHGYSFFNNDVVDSARYHSIVNLTRYIKKHGDEFEDEQSMVGVVMSCMRYGILSAFGDDNKKIEIIAASDLEYSAAKHIDSKYTKALVSYDDEIGGDELLYKELSERYLTPLESNVINLLSEGYNCIEIEEKLSLKPREAYLAKKRVQTRFKRIKKLENEKTDEQGDTRPNYKEEVREIVRPIRARVEDKPKVDHEKARSQYITAMSFLHSPSEIQAQVPDDWMARR